MKNIFSYFKSNPAMGALGALVTLGVGYWGYNMWFSPYGKFKKELAAWIKKNPGDAKLANRPITNDQQAVFDYYWTLKGTGIGADTAFWVKYLLESGLKEAQIKEYLIKPAA